MLGFGLTICFELKNGKKVTFDGSGFQEATTNYFLEWASVSISPKQLASASSVEEMIGLLTRNVMDGDRPIFEKSIPIESEVVEDVFDAYDFINMIRENICSMSDISNIFIELKEYNAMHFYRKYNFDTQTGDYTAIVLGTPEASEEYFGETMDQGILFFTDCEECKITETADLYLDSDPDDAFYGFARCFVE